jgi:pre-mRNA cleavage complex 2 protein Pcf11
MSNSHRRRTHLVVSLYQAIPDQCKQCGRRFPKTEDGKAKKMKHLDWHFSINSRVANSAQTSIVHRSAYLDELVRVLFRQFVLPDN